MDSKYHASTGRMHRVTAAYDVTSRAYTESWLADFGATFEAHGGSVAAAIGFKSGQKQPCFVVLD